MPKAGRLPSGVVSFLLTDVAGSTTMRERDGRALERALTRHDAVVADAVARHQGTLLEARGEDDSTFSVFARATDAVCAGVSLQRALAGVEWPRGAELLVRMAVHTGEVVERGGNYFGPAVNRATLLRSLGKGGEVLVSQTTAELVFDHLDDDIDLVDVGEQAVTGHSRHERVFAVETEGIAAPASLPRPASPPPTGGPKQKPDVSRPKVLVVDDHPLWRQTVKSLVERSGAASSVADAADGATAVRLARESRPDVIVMDMALPGLSGLDATREVTTSWEGTRVLVLSSSDEEDQVMEAVRSGATGYLLKTAEPEEIVEGLRRVHAGELVFPPSLTKLVVAGLKDRDGTSRRAGALGRLTDRETDVLALMAEGHTNDAIGDTLHLSAKTVERHVTSIFRKLDLDASAGGHRRVLAVIAYLRNARTRSNPQRDEG